MKDSQSVAKGYGSKKEEEGGEIARVDLLFIVESFDICRINRAAACGGGNVIRGTCPAPLACISI